MSVPLMGLMVAAAVLVAATIFGLVRRARDGRLRPDQRTDPTRELLAALGVRDGTPVTLLQFSSRFCAPCRATSQLCADVVATNDRVRHVEVDVETQHRAVQALAIRRTPTLLVVDGAGRVLWRAAGPPARADLLATVTQTLAGDARCPR